MLMRFFHTFSVWIASLNIPALSQSLKKEVEMWEVAGSGVRKGLFAVLVELHSDLAKCLPLSNADGAHWQLCSRSALTQHCSTHASLKALTPTPGYSTLSCSPTGDRGNQDVGQIPAQEGEDTGKAAKLRTADSHSLKS